MKWALPLASWVGGASAGGRGRGERSGTGWHPGHNGKGGKGRVRGEEEVGRVRGGGRRGEGENGRERMK